MKNTQKKFILITAVHVGGASQNISRFPEPRKVQEEVPSQYLVFLLFTRPFISQICLKIGINVTNTMSN
jgi:hypothetical protein